MPNRGSKFARERPVLHQCALFLYVAIDNIWNDSPMRLAEHWVNPVIKALLGVMDTLLVLREPAVVEHDRLHAPQRNLGLARPLGSVGNADMPSG
ncbi:hypothetical protein D3C87_1736910 [compost metagenome]